MERAARVVQLQTSAGVLSVELYNNFCADSFWQLAHSGQLAGLVFRQLVPGFALLGDADGAHGHCATVAEVDGAAQSAEGPPLRHVGAGLLTCSPSVGTVVASRFAITLSPQPRLDSSHVVFGRVYSGIQTVELISRMQVDARFVLYSPVSVVKCSAAVLPRSVTPQATGNATAASAPCIATTTRPATSRLLASLEERVEQPQMERGVR